MPVRPARPWLSAAALAVALAGSACGPTGTHAVAPPHYPPGHFSDPLSRELAQVADTPATRSHVSFGQAFRIVRANGLTGGHGPYAPLIGFGWSLNASTYELSKALGFQPELSATALTAGDFAHQAARLTGNFDTEDIGAKLRKLGAHLDHGTWRLRPDGESDITDPLGRRFPALTNQVNLVHATPAEVAYGPSAASITMMRATTHTLADDPAIRSVAACLDDPLVAEITDDGLNHDGSRGKYTLGIGVRDHPDGPGSDVLCRSARTASEAERLAASYRRILTTQKIPGRKPIEPITAPKHAHSFEASPYTDVLHGIKVTVRNEGTPTVRVTARPASWADPTVLYTLWTMKALAPLGP